MPTPLEELELQLKKWNATSMGRRTFLAAVPLLLAACATSDMHRMREGDNSGQEVPLTIEDERKMTKEAMLEVGKDYPPLQNADVQIYLKSLGKRLVAANALEGHPYNYNFTVVGVNQVNAFALPAGTIFVTAPLIAMAESEAELAGVVGHELGHVKARHAAERLARAKDESRKGWLYGAGGGLLGAAAGFGLGKLLCASGDTGCVAKATVAGAAAGVGGGLLIEKYRFMANTREDEMEADRIGFRTSVKTNYHKDHVGDFYAKLLRLEQESKAHRVPIVSGLSDALATHPPSEERVEQMKELSSSVALARHPVISTKEFDRAKKACQDWVRETQARTQS